ncbi:hypothetical protein CIT292_06440 [Citrobacter youngae ATCC 29220]|uniref:Uncharacterized protein n=1 Tax=Citrobacter youngae ATCC 29220 TaxID=500640 RepID=D4B8A0_9ENTR|nr:hypothetical protein CIT292_06440 [Citrobacter youngae ATCC 29220]
MPPCGASLTLWLGWQGSALVNKGSFTARNAITPLTPARVAIFLIPQKSGIISAQISIAVALSSRQKQSNATL